MELLGYIPSYLVNFGNVRQRSETILSQGLDGLISLNLRIFLRHQKFWARSKTRCQYLSFFFSLAWSYYYWLQSSIPGTKKRYSNLKEFSNIPGHDVIRHSADSCPKPAHGFPPLEGAGLSHVRLLYTLPWSHVAEHVLQLPHWAQFPSTISRKVAVKREFSSAMDAHY